MSESQNRSKPLDNPTVLTLNGWELQQTDPVTWELGSREHGGLLELIVIPLQYTDGYKLLHQNQPVENTPTHVADITNPSNDEFKSLIRFFAYRILNDRYDGFTERPDINTSHVFYPNPPQHVIDILSFLVNEYNDEYVDMEAPCRLKIADNYR